MKPIIPIVAALALMGCTTNPNGTLNLSAGQQKTFTALCAADPLLYAAGQGTAAAVTVAVPGGAMAQGPAAVDSLLVHPSIVAACAALNAKPVAVTPTPAAAVKTP